jgi:hypothetical protein
MLLGGSLPLCNDETIGVANVWICQDPMISRADKALTFTSDTTVQNRDLTCAVMLMPIPCLPSREEAESISDKKHRRSITAVRYMKLGVKAGAVACGIPN